jgi:hypothetical protein
VNSEWTSTVSESLRVNWSVLLGTLGTRRRLHEFLLQRYLIPCAGGSKRTLEWAF